MNSDIPKDEIDLHIEQDDQGMFIARAFHKPTATLKISDLYHSREEAREAVLEGLSDLIAQRKQGLA